MPIVYWQKPEKNSADAEWIEPNLIYEAEDTEDTEFFSLWNNIDDNMKQIKKED